MARKRKTPRRTPEEQARWDENTRRIEERIAYHKEMSELLGEREREQAALEALRQKRRAS